MRKAFIVLLVCLGFSAFSQTLMTGVKLSGFSDLDKTYYQKSSGYEIGFDLNWKFAEKSRHGFSLFFGFGNFDYTESVGSAARLEARRGSVLAAYNYYLVDKTNWFISTDVGLKYCSERGDTYYSGARKSYSSEFKALGPHTGFECAYILGPVVFGAGLDGIYLFEFGDGGEGQVNLFPFVAIRGVLP